MELSKYLNPWIYFKFKELKYKKSINPYKNILKRNKKYKNLHKGERCFILANGPSLNNLDFTLLENEVTFTVNQIVRNINFEKLKTNYHMWSDSIFFEIEDGNKEDMEMLEVIKSVSKKSPNVIIFYEITAKPMIDKYFLNKQSNIEYFQSIPLNSCIAEKRVIDFTHIVPNYPTVVDYAICLAVYMGFKEIYLLGCDCTGFINDVQSKVNEAKKNLYAFKMSDNAAKRMERCLSQRSIRNMLFSYVKLFDKYEELNKYCKRNGVKLINSTEGGLLECLPRINLEDVLNLNSS